MKEVKQVILKPEVVKSLKEKLMKILIKSEADMTTKIQKVLNKSIDKIVKKMKKHIKKAIKFN